MSEQKPDSGADGGGGVSSTPGSVAEGRLPVPREQYTQPPDGRPPEKQPQWWHDFPIDWPQDHYVARRDFTKFMVLTSLAFTVGQFWIAAKNFLRKRRGKPPIARIGTLSSVPVDGAVTFRYPGPHDDCILVRTRDGGLLAYSQKCTHLACAVIPDADTNQIHCPCHAGYFELSSGRPIAGPPRRPLPRITLEVRQGEIYATGVEERTV